MAKGKIGVKSENLFPIIKKFLYSDHDIFLREIVSNAVDASQKIKTLVSKGEYNGDIQNLKVKVVLDKENKTITVSDNGIGMTSEEVKKYINQIAFSGANEFLEKYKDESNIIGHFGLGFYSSFMVSNKVEIITKSYLENSESIKWSCDGTPEYTLSNYKKEDRGTDIIMYINEDSEEFLDENKLNNILNKYCKFLPIEIVFGVDDNGNDIIINDTKPIWTKKPSEINEEDYKSFYDKLYPYSDEPLFNIHLNVDYPFNLTGILYFPKFKNNFEIQKNKIQLYSNQVYVTDHVEEIVPEFLTLLHGVIDSPDIPLNVSRSYLQSDSNVKKISNHVTKKVADKLEEMFKNSRTEFELKWNDLRIFIEYGILTDDKFSEKIKKNYLLKNTDNKYFTIEEYLNLIKENQTDKNNKIVLLYASDIDKQYVFINNAKNMGYDVLLLDSVLVTPLLNKLEQDEQDIRFVSIDSDTINNIIPKDVELKKLSEIEKEELNTIFKSSISNDKNTYNINFDDMGEKYQPITITQNEFVKRMKDMSKFQNNSYSDFMSNNYSLIVNITHPLVENIIKEKESKLSDKLKSINDIINTFEIEKKELDLKLKDTTDEEEKKELEEKNKNIESDLKNIKDEKNNILNNFGTQNNLIKELFDIALLSNNMLTGEKLETFIKRTLDLIK